MSHVPSTMKVKRLFSMVHLFIKKTPGGGKGVGGKEYLSPGSGFVM